MFIENNNRFEYQQDQLVNFYFWLYAFICLLIVSVNINMPCYHIWVSLNLLVTQVRPDLGKTSATECGINTGWMNYFSKQVKVKVTSKLTSLSARLTRLKFILRYENTLFTVYNHLSYFSFCILKFVILTNTIIETTCRFQNKESIFHSTYILIKFSFNRRYLCLI